MSPVTVTLRVGGGGAEDRPVGESEDSYFGDFIEDESADSPTDTATQQMLREPHQHP